MFGAHRGPPPKASSRACLVVYLALGWNRSAHTRPLCLAMARSLREGLRVVRILLWQLRVPKASAPTEPARSCIVFCGQASESHQVPFTAFGWLQASHKPTQMMGGGHRPRFLIGSLSKPHGRKACGQEILPMPSLKNAICYDSLYAITHKYHFLQPRC